MVTHRQECLTRRTGRSRNVVEQFIRIRGTALWEIVRAAKGEKPPLDGDRRQSRIEQILAGDDYTGDGFSVCPTKILDASNPCLHGDKRRVPGVNQTEFIQQGAKRCASR